MNLAAGKADYVRQVWALDPRVGQQMFAEMSTAAAISARAGATSRPAAATRTAGGSIAVLSVQGLIMQRSSALSEIFGGTSTQLFSAQLREAADDDNCSAILVIFDSAGGACYGTGEAACELLRARISKPVIGFVDSQCASAAYWMASCCSELICTPGGETGSVGVWECHVDESEALKAAGLKPTIISAGRFKTEGTSFSPLSQEAKGFKQSRVDDYFRAFTGTVARGRRVSVDTVRSGFGEGRMLGAQAALKAGMVDSIGTVSDVIAGMMRNIKSGNRNASVIAPPSRLAAMRREIEIASYELESASFTPPSARRHLTAAQMRAEIAAIERGSR